MMKTCRQVQMRLAALRSDERPAPEVEDHIKKCTVCRRVLEADRQVWRVLDLYDAPAPPVDFLSRVERRLSSRVSARRTERLAGALNSLRAAPRMAVAASVLVVLGLSTGAWLGARLAAQGRDMASPDTETDEMQAYAQLLDVAPPDSLTLAYLSLDPGENLP